MQIKRLSLLIFTLVVSICSLGIMNIHYDVLSRYPYELSEEDADKLRNNLTYKEINYLIDYSINYDLFIDYVEQAEFNVYHFEYYNSLAPYLYYLGPGDIVSYSEKSIRDGIDADDLVNKLAMGYDIKDILEFNKDGYVYSKKDVLATDPLNYNFEFKNNETIYKLEPRDLVIVDYVLNDEEFKLRKTVSDSLYNLLDSVNNRLSFDVFDSLEITSGYISYNDALKNKVNNTLMPGKNYNQLGRVFTLECSGRNEKLFFEEFNAMALDFGFVLVNDSINEYLYVGK